MGPRPLRSTAPTKPSGAAPRARPITVEHRSLADRPRIKAKPDAAAQLREVAEQLQHLPRDALLDRAELLILLRRLANRVLAVAETGMEVVPSHKVRAPRQPFLVAPRADARTVAEGVFGKGMPPRHVPDPAKSTTFAGLSPLVTHVVNRKGRAIKVEIRRRALVAAGQGELNL